jgi:hypothetical protein
MVSSTGTNGAEQQHMCPCSKVEHLTWAAIHSLTYAIAAVVTSLRPYLIAQCSQPHREHLKRSRRLYCTPPSTWHLPHRLPL